MAIRLYNSKSKQVEEFQPLIAGEVRMYHCGPTVYQRPHIGNYRAFLFADLLRRFFEWQQLNVVQVMNLTDVGHLTDDADDGEDKLEVQAKKDKVDPWALVDTVSKQFFADLSALNVRPAHQYPRATDHIPEMVVIIQTLLEKNHAYVVGENVYFDVQSFPEYGLLSGNRVEELEAGARLEVNQEKRHPADFALWKSDPNHIMKWETPFGPHGFPGWHVECSAMAMKYLGESFDIHTGGEDNIFPHHECEIAQSECATGVPFAKIWMHTRFLQVDGGKMSKSLGNVYLLDDVAEQGFSPLDFRFLVLRCHYRGSMNFTWDALRGAAESRKNLCDLHGRLCAVSATPEDSPAIAAVAQIRQGFKQALEEDLNTSAALAALFDLRTKWNAGELEGGGKAAMDFLQEADGVLGFLNPDIECELSDEEINALINQRLSAREAKDFPQADSIRDQLQSAGIVLEDGAGGTKWHRGVGIN